MRSERKPNALPALRERYAARFRAQLLVPEAFAPLLSFYAADLLQPLPNLLDLLIAQGIDGVTYAYRFGAC